jgi:hypothetical protein
LSNTGTFGEKVNIKGNINNIKEVNKPTMDSINQDANNINVNANNI